MNFKTKWTPWLLASIAALVLAVGVATVYPQTTQAAEIAETAIHSVARWGGWGRGNQDGLLAEALGISEDELADARDSAQAAALAEAVEAGEITQEEADLLLARQAFRDYLAEQAQAEYTATIQAAVEAGAITQEQADLLLSQDDGGFMGRGFGRHGMGFPGEDGPRGRGMRGGR
jgi:hypothetical protein